MCLYDAQAQILPADETATLPTRDDACYNLLWNATLTRARVMQAKVLPVDGTAALPTAGGASARLVADKVAGAAGPNTLTEAPAPGSALLTDAVLFTDLSSQEMGMPELHVSSESGV